MWLRVLAEHEKRYGSIGGGRPRRSGADHCEGAFLPESLRRGGFTIPYPLSSFWPRRARTAGRDICGQAAGRHSMKQEEINRLLVELGKEGLYVVRLKGGDPFVFGRAERKLWPWRRREFPMRSFPESPRR